MVHRSRSSSAVLRAAIALLGLFLGPLTGARPGEGQTPVRLNRAIQTLSEGEAVFGAFVANFSPANAQALSRSGLDYIFIDMEHSPWDAETLRTFLYAMTDREGIAASGSIQPAVTPIVRVPQNGREFQQLFVKQALDLGAFGIMFPFVETREEALNAVASMRYARPLSSPIREPEGIRGRSGSLGWFWGVSGPEYYLRADVWPLDPRGELLAVIQIETPLAVANIEEIITVPGVGAIFVGPNDLSTQMGYGDQQDHPAVEAMIQTALQACLRHNMPCGITTNATNIEARTRQGFRFATVGTDAGIPAPTADALRIGRTTAGRE